MAYAHVPIQTFKRRRVTLGWVIRSLAEIAAVLFGLGLLVGFAVLWVSK